MSYRIRLEPSGHTFTALPEESLLEAALRSGINLTYSCSSGTCGDCKVRLLSGEVEPTMPSDYHFNLLERNEHYILMCSNRAVSDLVIQADEAHTPADIPLQQLKARVAKIEQCGEGVRILHLRTPRTQPLRFMAGQHVNLKLPGGTEADAAIGSCPCNGTQLQFHFPADQRGSFHDAVFGGLHTGDQVVVEGPFGEVSLDDDSSRPLLMMAMGTDFAPIKSLIEHAINLDLRQPIRLIWMASATEGYYMENYCWVWSEVLDDYRFIPLGMRGKEFKLEERALLHRAIEEQIAELQCADTYIAGSQQFVGLVREHLLKLGECNNRILELRRRLNRRPLSRVVRV